MNVSEKVSGGRFESPAGPVTKNGTRNRGMSNHDMSHRDFSDRSNSPFVSSNLYDGSSVAATKKDFEFGPGYSFSKPLILNQTDSRKSTPRKLKNERPQEKDKSESRNSVVSVGVIFDSTFY